MNTGATESKMLCLMTLVLLVALAALSDAVTKTNFRLPADFDAVLPEPDELPHGVVPCTCVDIRLCPALLEMLQQPPRMEATSPQLRRLQKYTCGFRGFIPFVCCREMIEASDDAGSTTSVNFVTSTPNSYDPTNDLDEVFRTVPPTSAPEPSEDSVTQSYDSGLASRQDASTPRPVSSSYDPTSDIAETFGNPEEDFSTSTNSQSPPYDPTSDIAETFGTSTVNNEESATTPPTYDPTYDIAETFGSASRTVLPVTSTTEPSTSSLPRTSETRRWHDDYPFISTSTASPDVNKHVPWNRTELHFHLESNDPPGNVTFHLHSEQSLHGRQLPAVTQPSPITVTYTMLVKKTTNMEKKYSDFKELFFKSFNESKKFPGPKANNNFYFAGSKRFPLPYLGIKEKTEGETGQSLIRTPRSPVTTRRFMGQYDSPDFYNFNSRQPYRPSFYPDNYYNLQYDADEPAPAPTAHHMRSRGVFNGIAHWWDRVRPKHNKPTLAHLQANDAIVFPNDSDDMERYQQYPPNVNSPHYPGSFYMGHHPTYVNQDMWGHHGHGHGHNRPRRPSSKPPPTTSASTQPPPPPTEPPPPPPPPPTTTTPTPATTIPPSVETSGTDTKLVPRVVPTPDAKAAKRSLLAINQCGVSVEERIVGGKAATLGAYPWIARIGYVARQGSEQVLYRCAGTLINNLYVLTAAHCLTNLPGTLILAAVRLGELDETTDPDCAQGECADPVQNYQPSKVIAHPSYNTPQFKNDVGLIRLDKPATMSSYVSPICLPFDSLSSKDFTGLKAVVAGWGASNVGSATANSVLQWVSLTVSALTQCAATFATRTNVQVGVGQMCAGGEQGRDSCEGDSGGPLMRPEQPDPEDMPRYYLIGIVSFGAKRCGSDNMPGVYTNVASYLDWILDTIQA